jgi:hypothetical protein
LRGAHWIASTYEADFGKKSLKAWFMDRYEFHPVYPGMHLPQYPDDERRYSNIVHAAAVELKAGTARDFWMMGLAVVPLDLILKA